MVLDGRTLADALPVYQADGDVLIPLGEWSRYASLAIRVDPHAGTAEGFIIDEDARFLLDARRGVVIVGGRESELPSAGVEIHEDDIYVTSRLLSQWMPVDFRLNFFNQTLELEPRRRLPIQEMLDRASRRIRPPQEFDAALSPWPRAATPHDLVSLPSSELTLSLRQAEDRGVNEARYGLRLSGDLLYNEFDAFIFGGDEGHSLERFTLGRHDPDARLLGALRAREVLAGTIYDTGSDLLRGSGVGDGILVTNYPASRQTRFGRQTLVGSALPGWDVELYRNEVLLAQRRADTDGLWEFRDVPLQYGLNVFRIVYYGPQGQRREEIRRFNVGESLVTPGETLYRFVAMDPQIGDPYALAEARLGLTHRASAIGGLAIVRRDGEEIGILKTGASLTLGPLAAETAIGFDSEGGIGTEVLFQGRLRHGGFTFGHTSVRDYEGELADPLSVNAEDRAFLRLDGVARAFGSLGVPLNLELGRNVLSNGLTEWSLLGRAGSAWRGTAVSMEIDGRRYEGTGSSDVLASRILVNRRVFSSLVRATLDYAVRPDAQVRSGDLFIEKRDAAGRFYRAGARKLVAAGDTQFSVGFGKAEGIWGSTAEIQHSETLGWSASLTVDVAAGWDPLARRTRLASRSIGAMGAASALVFVDRDLNGAFTEGDEPVPGVRFFVNGASRTAVTDATGRAVVDRLRPHELTEIALSESTIGDPYLRPTVGGVVVVPRPGKFAVAAFPLVSTGDVVGEVRLVEAAGSRPYGGIRLQAVDAAGGIEGEAISSYDGFFEMPGVRSGTYELRIAPAQAETLGLALEAPITISIAPGEVVEGTLVRIRATHH